MLSVLNCSLLFQVILATFVHYFYPEAKIGVEFRVKYHYPRPKGGTQWESIKTLSKTPCGTQWETAGHSGTEFGELNHHSDGF